MPAAETRTSFETHSAAAMRTALTGVVLALVLVVTSCATSSEADGKVAVAGPREAVSLIATGDYLVFDLRSPEAYAAGHVKGARSLPFNAGDFADELSRELSDGYPRLKRAQARAREHPVERAFVNPASLILVAALVLLGPEFTTMVTRIGDRINP